jgi:hypothetical protein
MWIKILKITKALDGNCRAGFGVVIGCSLRQWGIKGTVMKKCISI